MTTLRFRAVKLKQLHGVTDHLWATQVSTDGLVWFTLQRYPDGHKALHTTKGLADFVSKNLLNKEEEVVFETKL